MFLKTYFRICNNISNYAPVRPLFDDPDEEEQCGCGYRDDMIAQFEQGLFNEKFPLQDQGKDDEHDILENRNKFWLNIISNAQGPVPDKLFDFEYDVEGLDGSVRGAETFLEIREIEIILVILRCE